MIKKIILKEEELSGKVFPCSTVEVKVTVPLRSFSVKSFSRYIQIPLPVPFVENDRLKK